MAAKKTEKKMTYEEMENRVKEIIFQIDDESVSLDQQIALGEEGKELLDSMEKTLSELRAKIAKISGGEDAGTED